MVFGIACLSCLSAFSQWSNWSQPCEVRSFEAEDVYLYPDISLIKVDKKQGDLTELAVLSAFHPLSDSTKLEALTQRATLVSSQRPAHLLWFDNGASPSYRNGDRDLTASVPLPLVAGSYFVLHKRQEDGRLPCPPPDISFGLKDKKGRNTYVLATPHDEAMMAPLIVFRTKLNSVEPIMKPEDVWQRLGEAVDTTDRGSVIELTSFVSRVGFSSYFAGESRRPMLLEESAQAFLDAAKESQGFIRARLAGVAAKLGSKEAFRVFTDAFFESANAHPQDWSSQEAQIFVMDIPIRPLIYEYRPQVLTLDKDYCRAMARMFVESRSRVAQEFFSLTLTRCNDDVVREYAKKMPAKFGTSDRMDSLILSFLDWVFEDGAKEYDPYSNKDKISDLKDYWIKRFGS